MKIVKGRIGFFKIETRGKKNSLVLVLMIDRQRYSGFMTKDMQAVCDAGLGVGDTVQVTLERNGDYENITAVEKIEEGPEMPKGDVTDAVFKKMVDEHIAEGKAKPTGAAAPKRAYQSNDDARQHLIVYQSSLKVAGDVITTMLTSGHISLEKKAENKKLNYISALVRGLAAEFADAAITYKPKQAEPEATEAASEEADDLE